KRGTTKHFSNVSKKMKTIANLFSIAAAVILVAVISMPGGNLAAPQRAHIVILGTTDMHGRIFPIDYYTNKYDNVGIAKVATLIKRARKIARDPLLLDSGNQIKEPPLN